MTHENNVNHAPRFMQLALLVTGLGVFHHIDHIVRANHVGWPLVARVTPFTFSLLVYPLLLGGVYLTARNKVGARYWLVVSTAILVLVAMAHFNPNPESENVRDIYLPYAEPATYCAGPSGAHPPVGRSVLCEPTPSPARAYLGALAVGEMLALVAALALFVGTSARAVWRERVTPRRPVGP